MEIKVFVSSTFKDLHDYRTYLVNNVYPKLERMCWDKNISFTYVDFRWGIAKSELDDIVKVCLNQIEKCYPFFIGIVGDRYGTLYDAKRAEILKDEFPDLYEDIVKNEGLSITEMEFVEGIFKGEFNNDNAFCYQLRTEKKDLDPRLEKFILRITDSGHDMKDFSSPKELESKIIEDFEQLLSRVAKEDTRENSLTQSQNRIIQSKVKSYEKNVPLAEYVADYLNFDNVTQYPLIVFGDSGTGKTTFVAKTIQNLCKKNFMHFVGLEGSTSEYEIVKIIVENYALPIDINSDRLKKDFIDYISNTEEELIIMVDGINQTEFADNKIEFSWLPSELPSNVKVVMTCIPIENLKRIVELNNWYTFEINGFDEISAKNYIKNYLLNMYSKQLKEEEVDAFLLGSKAHYRNPFYLKNVIDEMVKVISFINVEEEKVFINKESGFNFDFVSSVSELIQFYMDFDSTTTFLTFVMERHENIYRPDVFRNLVISLANARCGLTFEELFAIVCDSNDDLYPYLEAILIDLDQLIAEIGNKYMLNHSQFNKAIESKYADQLKNNCELIIKKLETFTEVNYEEILFQSSKLYKWDYVKVLFEQDFDQVMVAGCDRDLLLKTIEAVDFMYGLDDSLEKYRNQLISEHIDDGRIPVFIRFCFDLSKTHILNEHLLELLSHIKNVDRVNKIKKQMLHFVIKNIDTDVKSICNILDQSLEWLLNVMDKSDVMDILSIMDKLSCFSDEHMITGDVDFDRVKNMIFVSKKYRKYEEIINDNDKWLVLTDNYELSSKIVLYAFEKFNEYELSSDVVLRLYEHNCIDENKAYKLLDEKLQKLPILSSEYAEILLAMSLLKFDVESNEFHNIQGSTTLKAVDLCDQVIEELNHVDISLALVHKAMLMYEYHHTTESIQILNCIEHVLDIFKGYRMERQISGEKLTHLHRYYKNGIRSLDANGNMYFNYAMNSFFMELSPLKYNHEEPYLILEKIVRVVLPDVIYGSESYKSLRKKFYLKSIPTMLSILIGVGIFSGLYRMGSFRHSDNILTDANQMKVEQGFLSVEDRMTQLNIINGIVTRFRKIYSNPVSNKNIYSFSNVTNKQTLLYEGIARVIKTNQKGDIYFLDENRHLCMLNQGKESKKVILEDTIHDYKFAGDYLILTIIQSTIDESIMWSDYDVAFMNVDYLIKHTDLKVYDLDNEAYVFSKEFIKELVEHDEAIYYTELGEIKSFNIKNYETATIETNRVAKQCLYMNDDYLVYIDNMNALYIRNLSSNEEIEYRDFQILMSNYDISGMTFIRSKDDFVFFFVNDRIDYALNENTDLIYSSDERYKLAFSYYIISFDNGSFSDHIRAKYDQRHEVINYVRRGSYDK